MTDAELKPCPFCGSDNLVSGGNDKVVGAWCQNCQATGPDGYLTINGDYDWNTRADLPAAVTVKPLEWGEHPDGEAYYAFPNDAGDCMYMLDLLESGRWRLFIGGDLVKDPDDPERVMKWDDPDEAKAYAQEDLDGRLCRLTPAPVADIQPAPEQPSVKEAARVLLKHLPEIQEPLLAKADSAGRWMASMEFVLRALAEQERSQ